MNASARGSECEAAEPLRLPRDLSKLASPKDRRRPDDLTVACYTFPNYHRAALNDRWFGPGWNEYILMQSCLPWFAGHDQPRQPLLGTLDERDPETWKRYLGLADPYGVDVFIWDCYWLDGSPALHEALEEGFLPVVGDFSARFAAMWTNHHWGPVFPTTKRDGRATSNVWAPAPKGAEEILQSLLYLLVRYCGHESYWRIDGAPVLVLWSVGRVLDDLGRDGTLKVIDQLRRAARDIGLGELHLHASMGSTSAFGQLAELGIDSCGSYQSIAEAAWSRPLDEFVVEYEIAAADVVSKIWPAHASAATVPFIPNVNPGFDTSPRKPRPIPQDKWPAFRSETPGFGFPPVVGDTPAAFEALMRAAFAYLNERPNVPPIVTIGCWNEWTEGAYLLPDTRHGYGMLEAVARARGKRLTLGEEWTITPQ